jgi:hypothetical protein
MKEHGLRRIFVERPQSPPSPKEGSDLAGMAAAVQRFDSIRRDRSRRDVHLLCANETTANSKFDRVRTCYRVKHRVG